MWKLKLSEKDSEKTDIKNWTERWEVEVKLKAKTTALNLKN